MIDTISLLQSPFATPAATLGLFPSLGGWEIGILLVLALLIFGKRLPEVGRSLGRGIVEFRKGVQGLQDEVEQGVKTPANPYSPEAQQSVTPSQPQDTPTAQTPGPTPPEGSQPTA
ncbi:MAG: twin-arginine translocase TatA/TatE family subunit [Planctomycetota bacterium]